MKDDLINQETYQETKRNHAALERIRKCPKGATRLDLSAIGFTVLTPLIGDLKNLVELDLSKNQLTTLPPEIAKLSGLKKLVLPDNRFVTLPPVLAELTALSELDLSSNEIATLPPEIGSLASLTHLDLSHNHIALLPEEISDLEKLAVLNLTDNLLGELPSQIVKLTGLRELYLHDNPWLHLPREVLGWVYGKPVPPGTRISLPAAIFDYYFERQRRGDSQLNELKLLLVGRGEAGKSSVSLRLRENTFNKDLTATAGIDIRPWPLSCPKGEVKVHSWDFAGQEITHETHRFFLSERSLYLVVLDGRGGQQMEEAEYWLNHVKRYGSTKVWEAGKEKVEHSPVIVVLNKWKTPGPYVVERRRLEREYPNIRAFVETDCADGHGIRDLNDQIIAAIEDMPSVWETWPMTYFDVREDLVALATHKNPAMRKHLLTWPDFRALCNTRGVTSEKSQTYLAENLNALGIALYYGADARLRDTRVLNPNWVANGLYGLILGVQRKPFGGKAGDLWAGNMSEVLEEGMKGMRDMKDRYKERVATITDYPVEKDGVKVHEFFLDLMVDRELCFQAGVHKNQALYLLPGLLPVDEPDPKAFNVAEHIDNAAVRFRYLYDILPPGVMSRLIVRTHPLSESDTDEENERDKDRINHQPEAAEHYRWQRGVVLGWGDARALVMAEIRRNPRIDVFIGGGTDKERQQLAGVVRSNMDEIHLGLPEGLRGREELELHVQLNDEQTASQYENVTKLRQLELSHQKVQIVLPAQPKAQEIEVTKMLDQVQPASARLHSAPKLKLFVSYAHENYKLWKQLKVRLDILKNEQLISAWWDNLVRPGTEFDVVIREEINQADIVVLMVSSYFLASPYIKGVEMKSALQRRSEGKTHILPVLLEPTPAFDKDPILSTLLAAPMLEGKLRDLTSFTPRSVGWALVEQALRDGIAHVAEKRRADDGGIV